ncbi:MAG: hypothetical protein IPK92_09065 [Nitrospira sp.]|nr:hypothetical protein [Nitrospira sp.]MBL8051926.1 hypothetical protein [Nitrospira sp.]
MLQVQVGHTVGSKFCLIVQHVAIVEDENLRTLLRLSDKFLAVAAVLFPDSPDSAVQKDYKTFSRLKDIRDSIYHGDEFSEKDLPLHELAGLLRKYMLAHVETPNPAVNKDAPTSGAPVT